MSNKKFVIISVVVLIVGFIGIFSIKYYTNLNDMLKKDGDTWGKPKVIMKAALSTDIEAEKYGDNYIVAFNNGQSLETLLLNNNGEILKSVSNDLGSKFIKDIEVNIYNDKIYITYVINIGGKKEFNILRINDDLEILENNKVSEVKRAINIKDQIYALVYEDRIELRDDSKIYSCIYDKVSTIGFIDDQGYKILVYGTAEGDYKYISMDDNSMEEPKLIFNFSIGQGVIYDNMSISINEGDLYLTFEQSHKNVFQDSIYYKYSLKDEQLLKDGSIKINGTKIKKVKYIGDNIFIGIFEEIKGMKIKKTSLVEFTFDENMDAILEEKIATYNNGYDYTSKVQDALFIGIFNSVDDYDIAMARPAQDMSDYKITKSEKSLLMKSAGEGVAYAVGFSFIFFLLSAVVYGIIFAAYSCLTKFSEGNKGIIGITIFSIVLVGIKCYVMISGIMNMCYMYMPDKFTSIFLWIGLNAIISFVMWSIGMIDIIKSKKEINLIKIYSLSLIDVFLSYTLIFAFVM